MRYFGNLDHHPLILKDAIRVPTPAGEKCLYCDDVIAPEDSGVLTTNRGSERPVHIECDARTAVGSVGHQLHLCSCNGGPGTVEDPVGMTKHQAAIAAYAIFKGCSTHGDKHIVVEASDATAFELGKRSFSLPEPWCYTVMKIIFALGVLNKGGFLNVCQAVAVEALCDVCERFVGTSRSGAGDLN